MFFESVSTLASHSGTELLSDVMHSQTLAANTWTCFDHQLDYNIHGTVELKHDALWFDLKMTKTTYKFGILIKLLLSYHKTFLPPHLAGRYIWLCVPVTCVLKRKSHNMCMCTNNTNTCTCAHAQYITAPIKNSHFVHCGNWSNFQMCILSCFVCSWLYVTFRLNTVHSILYFSTFSIFARPFWSANPLVDWDINTGSLRFI